MKTFSIDEATDHSAGLLSVLMYSSYCSNRDGGMTHEQLLSIGIGNEEMKIKYEQSKTKKDENQQGN